MLSLNQTPSSSKVEITTISSNYHIEINPSDAGNNDCFVVQEVIKEMASVRTLNSTNSIPFKVIILTGIEQLTSTAQAALRRTMEKYTGSCRLIFITETLSQVIEPVQSRCLPIRVGSPTPAEIKTVLEEIIKKEAVYIDDSTVDEIVKNSNRNLRRAIISLEVNGLHNKGSFIPDWELYIRKIASSILREQTPKQLLEIRKSLYDLLVNCIPPHIIINVLVSELSKSLDDIVKGELYKTASLYENRLRQGGKEIIHLEAFISQFMCDYKRFISSLDVEF